MADDCRVVKARVESYHVATIEVFGNNSIYLRLGDEELETTKWYIVY